MQETYDDYRTAVHEAGHAVVGRMCGMVCGGATIERDEDGSAYSITADPHEIQYHYEQLGRFIPFEKIMRRRIMTYMAGAEAENLFFGVCAGGDGDDRLQVEMMLQEIASPDEIYEVESDLRLQARSAVRWFEPRIATLAKRLAAERTMSEHQIDQAIGYVRPTAAPGEADLQQLQEPIAIRRK